MKITSRGKKNLCIISKSNLVQWFISKRILKVGSQRTQTKPCTHQDLGKGIMTPQETEPDQPVKVWGVSYEGLVCRDREAGSRQQQSWQAQHVAKVFLEEVAISPSTEPPDGQCTCWRIVIPKKFSYCCKISRPHNRLPSLGIW